MADTGSLVPFDGDVIPSTGNLKKGNRKLVEALNPSTSVPLSPKDQRALNLSTRQREDALKDAIAKERRDVTIKKEEEARKNAQLKPIPEQINKAYLQNHISIGKLDEALELLEANPDSTGLKGMLGGEGFGQYLLDKFDPPGTTTRASITDLSSLIIHDRSGATVPKAEGSRIFPFIPTTQDAYPAASKKLERLRDFVSLEQQALMAIYSKGYEPFSVLPQRKSKLNDVAVAKEWLKINQNDPLAEEVRKIIQELELK